MTGKKQNIKQLNLIQLFLGILIILLVNVIGGYVFTRFDLTSGKRYSISEATKKMLTGLDDIVYFKVYLEGDFPAGFERLSRSTREMLDEFRAYNRNIQYEFIDPARVVSESETRAFYEELIRKGLNPTDLQVKKYDGTSQQIIFPGALVSFKSKEVPMSLLVSQIGMSPEAILNNSVQSLEYNIAKTIKKLVTATRPDVAFIKGHGELEDIYLYDALQSASEYFNVERTRIGGELSSLTERDTAGNGSIIVRNKYDAIVIAQPDSIFDEKDKFIIDQFIMHGGKVLWFIDPVYATMDSLETSNQTIGIARDLNLDDMLFNYGVRLNNNLILDLNAMPVRVVTGMIDDQPQIDFLPWYFFPVVTPASEHPIVKNLNAVKTEFISTLDTVGSPSVQKTILLNTSKYSRTLKSPVVISLRLLEEPQDERLYQMSHLPVAVLLEGEFPSVFKNRIPPRIEDDPWMDFREKSVPTQMIVVSDGDMVRNQLHSSQGYPLPLGFDQYTRQSFGNRDFLLNALNYLTDDSGLILSRAKDVKLRLLDSTRLKDEKLKWQLINTLIPVAFILIYGVIRSAIRKRRYT